MTDQRQIARVFSHGILLAMIVLLMGSSSIAFAKSVEGPGGSSFGFSSKIVILDLGMPSNLVEHSELGKAGLSIPDFDGAAVHQIDVAGPLNSYSLATFFVTESSSETVLYCSE